MHLVGLDGLGQSIHDELSRHVKWEVRRRKALDGLDVGAREATVGEFSQDGSRVKGEMVWDDGLSTTGRFSRGTCGRRLAGSSQAFKSKVKRSGAAAVGVDRHG